MEHETLPFLQAPSCPFRHFMSVFNTFFFFKCSFYSFENYKSSSCKDEAEPVSTWYPLVVTVGPQCAQTHGWVLWGGITEAGAVLTPPAVSRVGIKI